MSLKLSGNGLFEASRMMLPEHKEAYNRYQKNLYKLSHPQLDEQELERIYTCVTQSLYLHKEITLYTFGQFEKVKWLGFVTQIDRSNQRLKLQQQDDAKWLSISDIIDCKE